MKPLLIYCYDAYCGWCYGFSPVMQKLWTSYNNRFDFEVLSGGMILPEQPVHIRATAAYIRKAYKDVETLTGVTFGPDYLWHIHQPEESDWYPDSEKPAIALCIFKAYHPGLQVPFAASLQYALHAEGRDLCDDEAYRHLLMQYDIPAAEFYEKLHSPLYREQAHNEFALVKQLQVNGYPSVLLQVSDAQFYLVSHGYVNDETLSKNLTAVLEQTGAAPI
jgi:putative protein-disulfide isomerase